MVENLVKQIAVLVGLNEVIKGAFLTEDKYKYVPIISVLLGVLVNVVLFGGNDLQADVLNGIISGLSAVGLFKLTKNVGSSGK